MLVSSPALLFLFAKSMFLKLLSRSIASSLPKLLVITAWVSSLLTTRFHRSGESTPPWGIPLLTYLVRVEEPSEDVTALHVSNWLINPTSRLSIPRSSSAPVIASGKTLLIIALNVKKGNEGIFLKLLDQHYIGSVPSQSEQKGRRGYSTMMEVYLQNL
ncbi:hypothetical protein ACLKA7_000862 [Drosophila subpalustris]